MKYELFINNQRADLPNDSDFSLSWESNLFSDVSKITSNSSTTINLPKTATNCKIFEAADVPTMQSAKVRKYLSARLVVDGVEMISDGYAVLMSYGDSYEVALTWGVLEGYKALSEDDEKLNEMTGFAYTSGSWTQLSTSPSTSATAEQTDWKYLYYDAGNTSPGTATLTTDSKLVSPQLPVVSVKWLLEQLQTRYGITFEVPEESAQLIALMYVVLTTAKFSSDDGYIKAIGELDVIDHIDDEGFDPTTDVRYTTEYSIPDTGMDMIELETSSTGKKVIRMTGDAKINFALHFEGAVAFVIGSSWGTFSSAWDTVARCYIVDIDLTEQDVEKGDVILFDLMPASSLNSDYGHFKEQPLTATIKVEADGNVYVGQGYPIQPNLPKMKAIEFIKEIMIRLGLFAVYTSDKTVLKFIKADTLIKGELQELPTPISVTNVEWTFGDYGQNNTMKYTTDDGGAVEGKGTLVVNNETLDAEKELFSSKFGMLSGTNSIDLYDHDIDTDSESGKTKVTYSYINPAQRLCYQNGYAATSEGLSFDEIINNHYKAYQSIIYEPLVIEASFRLSPLVVKNLDMTRPVFIRSLGETFGIIKITSANNGIYTFELIKI